MKKIKFILFFSLFKINNFFIFLDHFDVLILKIKKYYFNIFLNKKHFKKNHYRTFKHGAKPNKFINKAWDHTHKINACPSIFGHFFVKFRVLIL
jgi:hypothetical protein